MRFPLAPQQPQSETRISCRGEWWPPCQCWSLHPRSWPWGRPGCYEGVYWPLSQLCSMWNNIKGCNLVSWEATFPLTRWSTRLAFSQSWVCRIMGTSVVLVVCLLILVNIFSYQRRKWFGLDWLVFLWREDFYHSCRSWVLCKRGFENTDFFALRNNRDSKLPNECLYTFPW